MSTNAEIAITTTDNPYNPLTDYDRWRNYDIQKGYGTEEYLARVVRTTTEFGEDTYNNDIERAIDGSISLSAKALFYFMASSGTGKRETANLTVRETSCISESL